MVNVHKGKDYYVCTRHCRTELIQDSEDRILLQSKNVPSDVS